MKDEIIGKKFGRLLVIERADDYISATGGAHQKYRCICDCGNQPEVLKEHLVSGKTKSCGCLRKENGKSTHREIHTRLYRIWGNMCNRCANPNNPAWDRYGGRGITVCNEWKDYKCFSMWAKSNGYADYLTIDRINNNGGYNPSNCRWVDDLTQANNKRNNHLVEYNGKTMTIAEWSRFLGIPYKALHRRIVELKWTIERAFTQPVRATTSKSDLPNIKVGKKPDSGRHGYRGDRSGSSYNKR